MSRFGYKCQICGEGTVKGKIFKGYATKIRGLALVIPRAWIGVCDHCGEKHWCSKEVKRWNRLLDRQLAAISA